MLSASEVKRFVERLSILPIAGEYQQDPETISRLQVEAARAFMVNCSNRDAAERLCQRLIEGNRYFPTPSAIAEAASVPNYEPKAYSSCSTCGGTGWAAAFGVPCGKGKASRLDIAAIRQQMGEEGYYVSRERRVPKSSSEIARAWAVANRREVVEVSEPCMCGGSFRGQITAA